MGVESKLRVSCRSASLFFILAVPTILDLPVDNITAEGSGIQTDEVLQHGTAAFHSGLCITYDLYRKYVVGRKEAELGRQNTEVTASTGAAVP